MWENYVINIFWDITNFVIWLDNFTGYRKNWTLFTASSNYVNSFTVPKTITLRWDCTFLQTKISKKSIFLKFENLSLNLIFYLIWTFLESVGQNGWQEVTRIAYCFDQGYIGKCIRHKQTSKWVLFAFIFSYSFLHLHPSFILSTLNFY